MTLNVEGVVLRARNNARGIDILMESFGLPWLDAANIWHGRADLRQVDDSPHVWVEDRR